MVVCLLPHGVYTFLGAGVEVTGARVSVLAWLQSQVRPGEPQQHGDRWPELASETLCSSLGRHPGKGETWKPGLVAEEERFKADDDGRAEAR